MSTGLVGKLVKPEPGPTPIPVEMDVRSRERDIQKRLSRAKGRDASTAAGFLSTPPMVANLALKDVLG